MSILQRVLLNSLVLFGAVGVSACVGLLAHRLFGI
jgi:hypothetical protein